MIFYYQWNGIIYSTTNKNFLEILQLLSGCRVLNSTINKCLLRFISFEYKYKIIANYVRNEFYHH